MLLKVLLSISSIDFWHDTVVQLIVIATVTILSGAIGSVTTYLIYRRQRTKKEIKYRVLSDIPVASISPDIADRIEIRLDGKRVNGLRILILKLWNSGNTAVKPEDFLEPIIFKFWRRTILSSEILYTVPEDLINPKAIKTFVSLEVVNTEPELNPYVDDISDGYYYGDEPAMPPEPKGFSFSQIFLKGKIGQKTAKDSKPNAFKLAPFLFKPEEQITLKILHVGYTFNVFNKISASARILEGEINEYIVPTFSKVMKISPSIYSIVITVLLFMISNLFNNYFGYDSLIYFLSLMAFLTGIGFSIFHLFKILILGALYSFRHESVLLKW